MDRQTEYISAGITAAISILSISAVYFFDTTNPKTIPLLLVPIILLGYTAQNSKEKFKESSLASAFSLIFSPIGGLTAATSISITVLNPLVSYFANGNSFRDYYSSTSLPLIILGLISGLLIVSGSIMVPEFNNQLKNQSNSLVVSHAEKATNFFSNERDLTAVENTAQSTVAITESKVLENLNGELDQEDQDKIRESFEKADEEVPAQVKQNIKENNLQDSWRQRRIEESVEKATNKFYTGNTIFTLIILSPLLFYSFQPLLGILTAISAVTISRFELE